MHVLPDSELKELILCDDPIIEKVEQLDNKEYYDGVTSPIQPCSVDIRIEDIYLPSEEEPFDERKIKRCKFISLAPGFSVKVSTIEHFNFRGRHSQCGGLIVAPARITRCGVLILDVGHVDPGFKGPVRLTVYNLGKRDFELRSGDVIATVLIFRIGRKIDRGLFDRVGSKQPYLAGLSDIAHLALDPLDIGKKAKKIAEETVSSTANAIWKDIARGEAEGVFKNYRDGLVRSIVYPVILGVLVGFLTAFATYLSMFESRVSLISSSISEVKGIISAGDVDKRIATLVSTVRELEEKANKIESETIISRDVAELKLAVENLARQLDSIQRHGSLPATTESKSAPKTNQSDIQRNQ